MRQSFSPKKRAHGDSVDGMIPHQRRSIGTPTYYSSSKRLPDGFMPSQMSRRRPHKASTSPKQEDADPSQADVIPQSIGDFGQSGTSRSFGDIDAPEKTARKDKKKRGRGRVRSWWKNRSRKFKVFFVIFILLLGLGGLLGARLYSFLNSVFARNVGNASSAALNETVTPDQVNTEGDGRLNVLLLGRGGTENDAPDATDTIVIASIDMENQQASLLSIPRDTWVTVNGGGTKINAAFSLGKGEALENGKSNDEAEDAGVRQIIGSARHVAGVPIHKYVLTDYKAFRDIVNALGGVNVNVPQPINDYYANWFFKAGPQQFNGDRALQYARTRHGFVNSDFGRTQNQRQLLIAARQKATSTGIVANPVKLNSLANAVQKNIRTDLSVDEARKVFERTKDMGEDKIVSLDLYKDESPLMQTGNIGGQSIVRPVAGLSDFSKVRAYARSNMLDPFLKREAPTVAVYNGSGKAGAATFIGDVLAGYGYKVLDKETSQSPQSKTVVVKLTQTDKPFTYRYLSQRFKTIPVSDVPSGGAPAPKEGSNSSSTPSADFVIVLGADYEQQSGPTW